MSRFLHIVCLDTPWPADYGGAIDMMSRIKCLHQLGIRIHLHYFSYNERGTPNELNQYCESINVYDRIDMRKSFSMKLPYIVSSRLNPELLERLKQDNHPILLEGVHCTGYLKELDCASRKIVVRMHNEESAYYRELARAESNVIKKIYFYNESRLLKAYTQHLPKDCLYACITENDIKVLHDDYHLDNTKFLPGFTSWQSVTAEEGQGNFCLYHGNLSVPENEEAAVWLLCKVVTKARAPFIIAGKKPSKRLLKLAELCQHTCLIADPSETEMNDLVRKAHINVLPLFNKQQTGVRIKLLHALFEGRHCVANQAMVEGTGLADACHIGSNANAFASIILQLYHQPFTREEIVLRRDLLSPYNNEANCKRLIQWLW